MAYLRCVLCCVCLYSLSTSYLWFPLTATDAAITWTQPPPPHTPSDVFDIRVTKQDLLNGSAEQRLSWNFTLSDELLDEVSLEKNQGRIGVKKASGSITILNQSNFLEHFNISSSDPATLIIYDVTEADEGLYSCKVETESSTEWTDNIQVRVVVETKLTNVSDNQVECENSTVTLFCEATGKPQPNITWTRVLDNGSDGEIIQHETSPELVLNNIQRNQSGTYRCTAYNGVGRSFNQTMNVTVDFSPSIDPVANQTVHEEQNVSLSCNVSAIPSASVRWISPSGDVLEESSRTTLVHILRNQSGEYICEASNHCGNVSESVFISVQYKPDDVELQITPADKVCRDDMITLNCSAEAVPDVHTYQLFQNDMLLENSSSGKFHRSMSMEGDFMLKCVAINTVGSANSSSRDFVVNVPSKVASLANVTYEEGESFNVTCVVTGSPAPDVVWVDLTTGNRTSENVLNFPSVNRTQDGEYRCEATNECGNDSKSIFVIVHYPPRIVTISVNQTLNESDTVTLNCATDSKPPANVTWTRVSDNSSVSFPLTITGKQDEGLYRCTASNGVGSPVTKDVFITVENFRPFGTQVTTTLQNNVTAVNDTFNVTCTAEANPPAEYMIYKDDMFLSNITSHPAVHETSVTDRVNQARYKCVPFNSFGPGPEKEITIEVHYEPYNVQLMTNVSGDTTCTGQVVQLNCTVEANPPADVMLYRNDTMVTEAAPGIWYESVTTQGVAHYRCEANNSGGIGASNNVTLTFNVAPSIMDHPENVKVREGDSVTLYCNVSGIPEPNVTWTNLVSGESTSNKTLFIQNINRSQAGDYRCEATNDCGTDSLTSTITVLYQPENVQLLTNATASLKTCEGAMVNFTCTADANPAPSFTLYKDNAMVTDAQATPGVWILAMSSSGDFQYRCEANNSVGTDDSDNVTLTVNVGPTFNVVLSDQDVVEGGNLNLTCDVSGTPSPSVSWTTAVNEVKDENPLVITNIQRNQAGEYRCHASNECGNITDTLNVNVMYASFIPELTNETLNKGDNVTLFCNASGNPTPTVRWTKVDSGETRDEKTWYIKDVNGTDAGEYKCEAFNIVRNASDTVFVIVQYVPENTVLTSNLTGNTVCSGQVVNFTCQAEAHPPVVTYQLIRNGTFMTESESGFLLTKVMGEGNYAYHCVSNNSAGTDTSSSSLITVNSSPSVVAFSDHPEWIVGENNTLICTASGKPEPFISWNKKDGATRNQSIWEFPVVAEDHAGEYTCEASNECGTVQIMVIVTVYINRCKQRCTGGKSCRLFGIHACLCLRGKKGENCGDDEELSNEIATNFKITNEEYKEDYQNLGAETTKNLTGRIDNAFHNLFPNLNKSKVTALRSSNRPGSVDVDVDLTFNSPVGKTEVETALNKANDTDQFGDFQISNVGSAGLIGKPKKPCDSFYEGENCDKIKTGWVALIVIAILVVVAFIVAVIAFCMQKKKHNARSISMEAGGGRNAENGFRNGSKAGTESGLYARDNKAYEGEKFHTNGTFPTEPAQPMVTFTSPRPEETPGISINNPSATKKAQPGEGAYADLGDFRQTPQTPAPGLVIRPPAYEETPYAEITAFLKGPQNTEEGTENEEQAKTEDTSPTSSNNNEEVSEENEMSGEDEIQPMLEEKITNL